MTAHKVRRKRLAQGAPSARKGPGQMLRVAVSLPPSHFRSVASLARRRGQPVAAVIRDAVMFYLLRLAAEEDD